MFDEFFRDAAAQYSVPQWLLEAIAWTESSMGQFDGPGDGVGIMQVLPSTGRALGFSIEDLEDPARNIMAGAAAAADILARQGELVLSNFYSEYNSGRKSLWQTSTEVATHVKHFLQNVAMVRNVDLPAGLGIAEAQELLTNLIEMNPDADGFTSIAGVMIVAGVTYWLIFRG